LTQKYLLFESTNANISCLFTLTYTVIGHRPRGAKIEENHRTLLVMNTDQLEIG